MSLYKLTRGLQFNPQNKLITPTQFVMGMRVNQKHPLAKGLRYALFNIGNGYIYNAVSGKLSCTTDGGTDYFPAKNISSQYKENNTIFMKGNSPNNEYITIADAYNPVKLNYDWSLYQSWKYRAPGSNGQGNIFWLVSNYYTSGPYYDGDALRFEGPVYWPDFRSYYVYIYGAYIGVDGSRIPSDTWLDGSEDRYLFSHPASSAWSFYSMGQAASSGATEGSARQDRGPHNLNLCSTNGNYDIGNTLVWDRPICSSTTDVSTYNMLYYDKYFWDLFTLR